MAQVRIDLGAGEKGDRRKEGLKRLAIQAGFEYRGQGSIGKYICALADGELGQQTFSEMPWLLDIGQKVAGLEPEWLQLVAMDDCYGAIQSARNVMSFVAPEAEAEAEYTEPNYDGYDEDEDEDEDDDDDYSILGPPPPVEKEEVEELPAIYSKEEMEKASAALNWPNELFREKFDEVYGEGRGPLSR